MLILGRDLKAKCLGFGRECSGVDINNMVIRHGIIINNAVILNCERALNWNISIAKYLSTIVIIVMLLQYLDNSENDSKLKDWIDCSIYPKIFFRILDLGLLASALALLTLLLVCEWIS